MLDFLREHASSWIIKLLFIAIIVTFVLAYSVGGSDTAGSVATVNGEKIDRLTFQRAFDLAINNIKQSQPDIMDNPAQLKAFEPIILQQLVVKQLLLQEAKKLGIGASDDEIVTTLSKIPEFQTIEGTFDKEKFDAFLAAQTYPKLIQEELRQEIILNKLRDDISKIATINSTQVKELYTWFAKKASIEVLVFEPDAYFSEIKITQEMLDTYYKKNQEKYRTSPELDINYIVLDYNDFLDNTKVTEAEIETYYSVNKKTFADTGDEIRASHILIPLDINASKKEAAVIEEKLLTLKKEFENGKEFSQLAEDNSSCPSSSQGGDLGWFSQGRMVKEFDEVAFSLPENTISKPVRTDFGYHLILVTDKRTGNDKDRETIKTILAQEKAATALNTAHDIMLASVNVGTSLTDAAKLTELVPTAKQKLDKDALVRALDITEEQAQGLFLQEINTVDILALDAERTVLVEITAVEPSVIPAYKQVEKKLESDLRFELALLKAKENAEKENTILSKNEPNTKMPKTPRLVTIESVARDGVVGTYGVNEKLITDALNAPDGTWLKEVYLINDTYLLVKVLKSLAFDEREWVLYKNSIEERALQGMQQELIISFVQSLESKAKIKINQKAFAN